MRGATLYGRLSLAARILAGGEMQRATLYGRLSLAARVLAGGEMQGAALYGRLSLAARVLHPKRGATESPPYRRPRSFHFQ